MRITAQQFRHLRRRVPGYTPRKSAEHRIQVECVDWFRAAYPCGLLLAIPNGAKLGSNARLRALEWARLEAEGAIAGAGDLILCHPSGDLGGLFLECKTRKGEQSDTQKAFESLALGNRFGYAIFRNLKEFQNIVTRYLETGEY